MGIVKSVIRTAKATQAALLNSYADQQQTASWGRRVYLVDHQANQIGQWAWMPEIAVSSCGCNLAKVRDKSEPQAAVNVAWSSTVCYTVRRIASGVMTVLGIPTC